MNLQPRRVAIIKPSALGDIAHALPVLSGLRRLYPDAHISWVVNKGFAGLLQHHPQLNATLEFDRRAYKNPVTAVIYTLQLQQQLRRQRFDLVLDLQGLLRTGLMTAATGAPVRLGFATAREGSRHFYSHRLKVPDADRIHAVDRYWRMIEFLGGGHLQKEFRVPVDGDALNRMLTILLTLPQPWIAVAPGARWLTKRWPVEKFAELLNQTQAKFGGTTVLLGAPDDIALSADLTKLLKHPCLDLTGKTSIAEMVAVLSRSAVMISNDTGPLHVAVALGVPCVAAYLCTKVNLHGPYMGASPKSAGVPTMVPCAGSYVRKCPHGLRCFADVAVGMLAKEVSRILTAWIPADR